jgi:hypothetical protein
MVNAVTRRRICPTHLSHAFVPRICPTHLSHAFVPRICPTSHLSVFSISKSLPTSLLATSLSQQYSNISTCSLPPVSRCIRLGPSAAAQPTYPPLNDARPHARGPSLPGTPRTPATFLSRPYFLPPLNHVLLSLSASLNGAAHPHACGPPPHLLTYRRSFSPRSSLLPFIHSHVLLGSFFAAQ